MLRGERVRLLNAAPVRPNAEYVLYWAQMNRRAACNQALGAAVELANSLRLPVLCYEGLTCSYPYASARLHGFILDGAAANAQDMKQLGVGYLFHARQRRSDPDDALYVLARRAAAVVTDDYPTFIARWHNERVPAKLEVPYYAVDASCIVPMNRFEKREYAARTIRPKIEKVLANYLAPYSLPRVERRWHGPMPFTPMPPADVSSYEVDQSVGPVSRGGAREAHRVLERFLENSLRRYARDNREPGEHATSGLSPYLHFGHISALEVALAVRDYADQHQLIGVEFLEQLIVRRELAFNYSRHTADPAALSNVPSWALATLRNHEKDPRPYTYSRTEFENAATHDALWNAMQRELLTTGLIHGYYRMYWGKKIIEWSANCEEALATMIELNDRYALDGRDPNTYTNILWCFGLHDRPWGERPIFGMVRTMSLEGMYRKTRVDEYIRCHTR